MNLTQRSKSFDLVDNMALWRRKTMADTLDPGPCGPFKRAETPLNSLGWLTWRHFPSFPFQLLPPLRRGLQAFQHPKSWEIPTDMSSYWLWSIVSLDSWKLGFTSPLKPRVSAGKGRFHRKPKTVVSPPPLPRQFGASQERPIYTIAPSLVGYSTIYNSKPALSNTTPPKTHSIQHLNNARLHIKQMNAPQTVLMTSSVRVAWSSGS